MEDKELLAQAAQAAGYKLDGPAPVGPVGDMLLLNEQGGHSVWNPLRKDDDALRLAVDLEICVEFGYCLDDAPIVRCGPQWERDQWPQDGNFPDPYLATRRAIVRAAVKLGQERALALSSLPHY